jgi:hypothetical protein
MWKEINAKIREAQAMNEIAFGQFAPNSRTSATEVASTQENTASMLEAVARTIEAFLEALLDMVWKCAVQHLDPVDVEMAEVVGEKMWVALMTRRKELATRRITFRVRSITGLIAKGQKLRSLMQLLQMLMQIPPFAQAFMSKYGPTGFGKVFDYALSLIDIDTKPFEQTAREAALAQMTGAAGLVPQPGGAPAAPAPQPIGAPAV